MSHRLNPMLVPPFSKPTNSPLRVATAGPESPSSQKPQQLYVYNELNRRLRVPNDVAKTFPSLSQSVTSCLEIKLPGIPAELTAVSAPTWFSEEDPTFQIQTSCDPRSVPSREVQHPRAHPALGTLIVAEDYGFRGYQNGLKRRRQLAGRENKQEPENHTLIQDAGHEQAGTAATV
ncbi:hypothetical protein BJ165DRAFT_1526403 [Panaeolus papilionaceus]|nr:hypothetical protein BJ165DRAFT_1526403 [Panaeolus papilionaceus]